MFDRVKPTLILCLLLFRNPVVTKRAAHFLPKSLSEQEDGLVFVRVGVISAVGLTGQNSPIECMTVCMNYESCRSFYVTGGTCIFGLTDVMNELQGMEQVLPPTDKILQTKDIDECFSSPCVNGECSQEDVGYVCSCAEGWTGPNCEDSIDDCEGHECVNNATCVDGHMSYTCQCAAGFEGERCQVNIDECGGNECQNGATCEDGVNSFICTCAEGFTGQHCEENIDDCVDNDCQNAATCVDVVNSYTCTCAGSFFGDRCTFIEGPQKNWIDAKQHCEDLNGHLLAVRSQAQYEEAQRIRAQIGVWIWLGGNDLDNEGEWKWASDGANVDMTAFWDSGEPNNLGGNEDCMVMSSAGFLDLECNDGNPFVCELD